MIEFFLCLAEKKKEPKKEKRYLGLILLCVWQNFSNTIIKNVQSKYPLSFSLFQKETKQIIMEWLCPL